jgi:hypothetical protein
MRRARRLWFGALLALVALTALGCDEGGIGMGVPTSTGARWGTGGSGPGVIVGGGPVY